MNCLSDKYITDGQFSRPKGGKDKKGCSKIEQQKIKRVSAKDFVTNKAGMTLTEFKRTISFHHSHSIMNRNEAKETLLGGEFNEVFCTFNTKEQKIFSGLVLEEYYSQCSLNNNINNIFVLTRKNKQKTGQKES